MTKERIVFLILKSSWADRNVFSRNYKKYGHILKEDTMDCLKCERKNLNILKNKKYQGNWKFAERQASACTERAKRVEVAPWVGLEPTTRWLTVTCSTNWAIRE